MTINIGLEESKLSDLIENDIVKNDTRSLKKHLNGKRYKVKYLEGSLIKAVDANIVEVVQLLLDHVKLDDLNDALRVVFSAATELERKEFMRSLTAIKLPGTSVPSIAMCWAAEHGYKGWIKTLLDSGVDVNTAYGVSGSMPFRAAASSNHVDCLMTVIEHLADAKSTEGGYGLTALHLAALNGNVDFLTALIQHGADVSPVAGAWTPLHSAAAGGHTECVTALLQHGADINSRYLVGLTPLHLAGRVDCFEKLVQSGADTTLRNIRNKTELDVAKESTKVCT